MEYYNHIQRAIEYIEKNLKNPISVQEMANEAFISLFHFQRIFLIITGKTPGMYLRQRRLTEAAKILIKSKKRHYRHSS